MIPMPILLPNTTVVVVLPTVSIQPIPNIPKLRGPSTLHPTPRSSLPAPNQRMDSMVGGKCY